MKLAFVCRDCGQLWKLLHMRTCRYWIEKSKVVVKWQCKTKGPSSLL
jgi:hypothetical protein